VSFGEFGLQSMEPGFVTARQLEAGRVSLTHHLQREGKVTMRVFPHKPITAKPLETRMGKGKGEPAFWTAVVKPGTVLFEVAGVSEQTAKDAFCRVARKLPVRVRFIKRQIGPR
jgi:large subunit ribosomal protein L16